MDCCLLLERERLFFTWLIFLLCSNGTSANVSYNMSSVLTYPGQGVVGIVWWGRLRLACKKHRNGSRHRKDLVMNEAIMRETIAFFSQRRSTTGSVGGGVRALVLQCSTPTYLRDLIVRFFILHMSISIKKANQWHIMFSDFLTHLEYVVVLLRFFFEMDYVRQNEIL